MHSYYQDLRAQVTSLPKYGKLSSITDLDLYHPSQTRIQTQTQMQMQMQTDTSTYSQSRYSTWPDLFQIATGPENLNRDNPEMQILTAEGAGRKLGLCYGTYAAKSSPDGHQYCSSNYGIPPSLSDHVLGNRAEIAYLRDERVVSYIPNLGYRGPDFFTYIIYDGLNVQSRVDEYSTNIENEVTLHVRNCRPVDYKNEFNISSSIHSLCVCAETKSSLIGNEKKCYTARQNICGVNSTTSFSTSSSLSGAEEQFYNMCVACPSVFTFMNLRGKVPLLNGVKSECISQIMRAVSMLQTAGLCTYAPHMDCTAESVTIQGREKVNYLSLKYPPGSGSFSKLGNSFGGTGWFGSAASGTP